MPEWLRHQLIAYFDEEVGPPPVGAPDRLLSELSRGRPRPTPGRRRLATAAAIALALLTVTVLILSGQVHRTAVGPTHTAHQPATPVAPSSRPSPAVAEPAPPSRYGPAVAYDVARAEVLLFGGVPAPDQGSPGSAVAETWTWTNGHWTLQHPAAAPSARRDSQMAYDAARSEAILFGGRLQHQAGPENPGLSDTWTWDGRTWTQHAGGLAPPFDERAAMAYDPASRSVLWYRPSGRGPSVTWRWDGQGWSPVRTTAQPAMASATIAWDGKRLLLFGRAEVAGGTEAGGSEVMETWAWAANQDWVRLSPPAQPSQTQFAAAFDEGRRELVALGLPPQQGPTETWVWDGQRWSRRQTAHQPPPLTYAGSVVYDVRSKRVLAYGRQLRSPAMELWAWDGRDWTSLAEWT
jgi:hypothetical protein